MLLDALSACCLSHHVPDATRSWALNHLVIGLSVHSAAVTPMSRADHGQDLPQCLGKEIRAHDENINGCVWHRKKKLLATM